MHGVYVSARTLYSFSYLVRRGDVLAAWSGLRPLVMDPNKKDTQSIARNHVIEVSEGKLVTIAGGELICNWRGGVVGVRIEGC